MLEKLLMLAADLPSEFDLRRLAADHITALRNSAGHGDRQGTREENRKPSW